MTQALTALAPEVLRALFDHLPDTMFFIKDREARYVMVNDAMVRRSGKRRGEEVLGQTVADLFPGVFGRNTTQTDLHVIARGEIVVDKLELYHVPGPPVQNFVQSAGNAPGRWCLTHKYPVRDLEGRTTGLAGISRDLPRPDRQSGLCEQVARVAEYVEAHLGEGLRVPDLARVANLSQDRLERGARQVFGLTPKQLVMKARAEAASRLLRQTSLTVSEVSYRCGYADHSAFTRSFRGAVGLTPTRYRAVSEAGNA